MRRLFLLAAATALLTGPASAEVSGSGATVGFSGLEYLPEEGGSDTQVAATNVEEEDVPARFVDLGPRPDQFAPRRAQTVLPGGEIAMGLAPFRPFDPDSGYRPGILTELPTFLSYEPSAPILFAATEGGGGSGSTPLPVPLPATGLLLAAAIPLLAGRRR